MKTRDAGVEGVRRWVIRRISSSPGNNIIFHNQKRVAWILGANYRWEFWFTASDIFRHV